MTTIENKPIKKEKNNLILKCEDREFYNDETEETLKYTAYYIEILIEDNIEQIPVKIKNSLMKNVLASKLKLKDYPVFVEDKSFKIGSQKRENYKHFYVLVELDKKIYKATLVLSDVISKELVSNYLK